jgi:hypothetical protein
MTEFDDVIRRLRDQRPEPTPLELDQIKHRVRRNAAQGSRRSHFMKSRLAILGALVAGMLFTTTGVGVAVTSITSDTNAASQQYGGGSAPEQPAVPSKPSGGVEGKTTTRPQAPHSQGGAPEALQQTRQVEAGAATPKTSLPFTGFAAIPVLLLGLGLLTSGVIMRRRVTRDDS